MEDTKLSELRYYIKDLMHTALSHGCSHEDLLRVFTEYTVLNKIILRSWDKPVETIQSIEKEAIECIKDVHINERGREGKQLLKDLGLYDGDPNTLTTFPSYTNIQFIHDMCRSNDYHIFLTRGVSNILYDIRHKYYIPIQKGHWQQMIFPFEEGLTVDDLMDTGVKAFEHKKIPHEAPISIVFAHKSRMTLGQLISEFISDPKEAEERHKVFGAGQTQFYSFIDGKDRFVQTWIDRLSACLDDEHLPHGTEEYFKDELK